MTKPNLKIGQIVTIKGDTCFAKKQGKIEDIGTFVVVGIPKMGLTITMAPFFRKDLIVNDDWTLENKALLTFKDFDKIIPFTGTMVECSHEECKEIATETVLVIYKRTVMELPVCVKHAKCHGKCAVCLKIRVSC